MSDIISWADSQHKEPGRGNRLSRVEARAYGQALTRLEHQAGLENRSVELQEDIGRAKVHAVAHVGNEAMMAQALIAGRQRLLVESEPQAIHGVSYISQKLTMALGAVVDDTVRQATQ